jgi:putative nucleotidyltransferase with HDIG domain
MNAQASAGGSGRATQIVRLWRAVYGLLIGLLFVGVSTVILLFPILPLPSYDLELGDIAPEDVRAPRDIAYTSQIETQAAREAARASVKDIYDPPAARKGREQVLLARKIMNFVRDVRADSFADGDLRLAYLNEIIALENVASDVMTALLSISSSQFEQVEGEVVSLVEEAMSGTVREGREGEVVDQLELKVSTDLPEDLIPLTVSVARELVVANSYLNEGATEEARDGAETAVLDIRREFRAGEVVIRAGEPVDELDLEALEALGLATEQVTWEDVASALLASLLSAVAMAVYLAAFNPPWADKPGYLLLIVLLALLFLLLAQIMVPGQRLTSYLFPAAALSLALTALVGIETAALVTVVLAVLAGYMADGSLEIAVFVALSGALAAGSLRSGERLNAFFRAGIFAAITGTAVLFVFRLPARVDTVRLAQFLLMALLNGLLSTGIALVILFVVGGTTGLTTSLRLIDLSRPDHPLQRRLQQEALGTYQHTLSVANLAEAAAEAIGANSLLTRVGTLYHDIGKVNNPGFFGENRTEGGLDPHKGLSPFASARIIKAHVEDGIDLARRHRLPPEVVAFIAEHHGTMPILFFLEKAREEAAKTGAELDESAFRYDGPAPRSRETAILMLADGCESAVRANRPANTEEIKAIVTRIIQQRLELHQLDASGLTLTDIKVIQDTFVRALKGMYHPRVKYPGDEKPAQLPGRSESLPDGEAIPIPVASEPGARASGEELPVEGSGADDRPLSKD